MSEERERGYARSERGLVIKVDSRITEDTLFKEMAYQIPQQMLPSEVSKDLADLSSVPRKVTQFVHSILQPYMSTILGGQIISPHMGKDIVIDRIIQFAEIMLVQVQSRLGALSKKIYEKKIRGEDFEAELRDIFDTIDTSFITVRELINRLLTTVHINAPATIRPPLANIKIGYDKLD